VLALTAGLSACGSSGTGTGTKASTSDASQGVTVSGAFGSKPTIKIDAPLKVSKSASFEAIKGTGDPVASGKSFLIHLTLADGRTGKTVVSTYDPGQSALSAKSGDNSLFPALSSAIVGTKEGSRVVLKAAAADAYGSQGATQFGIKGGDPVVMVADVLGAEPTDALKAPQGTAVKPAAGAPKLITKGGKPTGFDFTGTQKPKKVTLVYLTKGTGPKLKNPSLGTFNYLGSEYGSKKVFDESYSKEPVSFAVGIHQVIQAWDQALVGVPKGSRVLILTPPGPAYGAKGSPPMISPNASLAFVVDVLGVS
jgi:peptidylprolyl isomerase